MKIKKRREQSERREQNETRTQKLTVRPIGRRVVRAFVSFNYK